MGSWDLPGEHDKMVGERDLLRSVTGTRVLSTGVRGVADHIVILYASKRKY